MAICLLLISLAIGFQLPPSAHPPGITPRNVKGDASPNGITVSVPDEGFMIEIPGKSIKPLSSERLVWSVDAMIVELLVASPSPLLVDSATEAAILRDYQREITGSKEETFSTARGLTGVLWMGADRGTVAAVVVGRRIAVLAATPTGGATEAQARAYLKAAMSTLQPIVKAETPAETRRDRDRAASGPLRNVDRATLVEVIRLLLRIEEDSLIVTVFDGRQGHTIEVFAYDFKTEAFEYSDPWGTDSSFLEFKNNAAGVAARRHPSRRGSWLLSFDDMARVLQGIVVEPEKLVGVARLSTLAGGSPEKIVATYRALHFGTPDLAELAPERLEKAANYLMGAGKPDAAVALLATRLALHPAAPASGLRMDDARVRALAAPMAQPKRPRPPQFLESAKREDFFTGFQLEHASVDGTVVTFRPTTEKFRPLVEVEMTTTTNGAITARELRLDRAFIDDPALTSFARDIANNFLSFSVDSSERAELQEFSDEISRRERPRVPIPGSRAPGATIEALPSPAAMTYLGQHPSFELVLPASVITLRNVASNNGGDLVITVVDR